jgi:hypothetical protein
MQTTIAIALKPVEERLDTVTGRLAEVVARLDAVADKVADLASRLPEPALEAQDAVVGEDPAVDAGLYDDTPFEDSPYDEDRVSVPAVPLDEVRMSSVASRALFGG